MDNIFVKPSADVKRVPVATEVVDGVHYPIYKPAVSAEGADPVHVSDANPMPVSLVDVSEAAPLPVALPGGLLSDAWGRSKVALDFSVFHGMFTVDVPASMWIEDVDGVEVDATNFTSAGGALLCTGVNGQTNRLLSKRHPRYQPNRGYLYSSSMLVDTAANAIDHDFGSFTETSGMFFRVNAGSIYAVLRTTVSAVTTERVEEITFEGDLTKGNIFDIQAQWRGVGNIKFFINLVQVYEFENLGTLSDLSVNNPAMPIGFSVNGLGSMRCGCVDISSEGGLKDTRQLGFTGSGEIPLSNQEVAVLALWIQPTITYEGIEVRNTFDAALRRLSAFADGSSLFKAYYTRDASKFVGTTWSPADSGAAGQVAAVTSAIVIDSLTGMTTIESRRIPANGSIEVSNPDEQYGDFYLTGGDYIVLTLTAKANVDGGASLDWGTEI